VGGIQLVAHPFSQSNPLKLLGSSTTIYGCYSIEDVASVTYKGVKRDLTWVKISSPRHLSISPAFAGGLTRTPVKVNLCKLMK